MAKSAPEVVLECRNWLGESVIRDDRKSAVYWVNLRGKELWRWQPFERREPVTFPLPEKPGAVSLRRTDGLVLGLESGFALFDDVAGGLESISDAEAELPTTRLNDGRVDPAARFVCGGMVERDDQHPLSAVHALDPDRTVRRILSDVSCSNSTCSGVDGRALYFRDMPTRRIDQFDSNAAHGAVGNRLVFVSFEDRHGLETNR